jgi:penicillin-binding protein 2
MSEPNSRRRLVVIGVIVMALFGGLLTRLWFLQVAGGEKLAVAAQQNRDRFVKVPAVRGTIYDAKGNVLAQTIPVTTLTVNRQQLSPSERKTLEVNLASLLSTPAAPVDAAEVDRRIDNQQYASYLPVPVAANIDLPTAVFVMEHRDEFPEISVTRTAERVYPHDYQAADMLGYVGQINGDELAAHKSDGYQSSDIIGKIGLEKMFESELRGTPGLDKVEVDNQGRAVNVVEVKKPVAGHDVRLTVDLGVQQIAETSLAQGMAGAQGLIDPDSGSHYAANAGAVVVLNARDGSVVAQASNPSFDPNDFVKGDADKYFNDPNHPLINRALNAYAPGSTFKTFTSLAMLQSGLEPEGADHVVDENPPGCFTFGNDEQRCNASHAVLGSRSLVSALTVSSDVYFYSVGNDFWNRYRDEGQAAGFTGDLAGDKLSDAQHPVGNAIQHTADTYGFGAPTGIGLDDQAGVIPNHEYRVKLNPNDSELQFWRRGDSASLAVGQGDVLVTPLQLADAYAAFANGGTLYQPRLADEVTQSSAGLPAGQLGPVVHAIDPLVRRTTSLSPEVSAPIMEGLDGVVNSENGTATGAFSDYQGVHVIGKTGTAERKPNQDTSWFVAITNPDNNPALPQYVIVAMVEQGGFGANVAAPIVRRVIDFLNNPNQPPPDVAIAPAVGNEQSN